ncbi:hypothetical protein [Methylotenera sp.]|uniref:hypothetical protein n=1 Tax=Methylotenera sp. TaxID=2051956 RepID=UPI002ED905FF
MCGLGSTPKIPAAPPPIVPPQAEKAPEQETFKRKNIASSRGATNSGTILTGSSGDAVPQGQLGASTLLGG